MLSGRLSSGFGSACEMCISVYSSFLGAVGRGKRTVSGNGNCLGWDVTSYCTGLRFNLNPVSPGCQGPLLMTCLPWAGGRASRSESADHC